MIAKRLAVVLALSLIFACGGDAEQQTADAQATATPVVAAAPLQPRQPLSEADVAYFKSVRGAWNEGVHQRMVAFGEAMGRLASEEMTPQERLFAGLKEAGAGTGFRQTLEAVRKLEPTQGFETDHQLHLKVLGDLVALDSVVAGTIEEQDLVAFTLANWQLGRQQALAGLEHSGDFCASVLSGNTIKPLQPCKSADALPYGAYGERLFKVLARTHADYVQRMFTDLSLLNQQETLRVVAVILPGAAEGVEEALDTVRKLEPPLELLEGHQRVVKYLEEQLEVVRALPYASGPEEFESEFARAWGVFCSAREQLPRAMWLFTSVHFADSRGSCQPEPPPPPDGPPPGAPGSPPPGAPRSPPQQPPGRSTQ